MDKLVPIISVAGLRSEDPASELRSAHQLGVACREVGFFMLSNHASMQNVGRRRLTMPKRFFCACHCRTSSRSDSSLSPQPIGRLRRMADEKLNPASGAL